MDPRYPIGKYESQPYSEKQKENWINDIKFLPQSIENALQNLDEAQQNTPYREGGWTVKQLVHHVADSHMNAYIRFKLGLTEDNPTIKPYEEGLWAQLSDSTLPTNLSVTILHAMHTRWYHLLTNIKAEEWNRTVFHPAQKKEITLWNLLGIYSWHSRHHTAHITKLREANNW
jgi:DinB superfamily